MAKSFSIACPHCGMVIKIVKGKVVDADYPAFLDAEVSDSKKTNEVMIMSEDGFEFGMTAE